jgi:hypothetical protein
MARRIGGGERLPLPKAKYSLLETDYSLTRKM